MERLTPKLLIQVHRKHDVVSTGTNFIKVWLSMCLLGVLRPQVIIVKCTAAIIFFQLL